MRSFSPRNLSLRYVLLLAVLLGLLIPSWIAFAFEKAEVQERLFKELTSDRDRYADLLAVSLREPLWQLAPLFAEPLINKIMEDPKVTRIVVKRMPEGQVFLERGAIKTSSVDPTERDIQMQGNTLGTVSVQVNEDGVTAATAAAQQRFLWRTAYIGAAAILLIFITLHLRLTRPVDKLVMQSEALADGRLHETMEWHRDDELGRVGHSLENTRRALSKLVGELQTVNVDLLSENAQRKKAETEIARHAEVLESRVAERTQELSATNATLSITLSNLRQTQHDLVESKKLASLGRMVAGVAHELNTPIGNALTIGSTIGERVRELQVLADSGQLKKSTLTDFLASTIEAGTVLERSLARAAELVTSFKRVAESDSKEKSSTFELVNITTGLASSFSASSGSLAIDFQNLVPPGIFITGYPELLRQVLDNLLSNTLVHAFDNRADGRVIVQAYTVGDQVEITVSDNGIGIADEIHSKVFDPMFTTRMGRGGVGLGLSVVHNIVTRHLGGKIHVRHAHPRGACFVMTLPLIAPLHPGESDE
jgi:two-component system NtrC family sensor kinase